MICHKCDRQMRTRHDPDDGRPLHMGRRLCRRCYRAEAAAGTLHEWPPVGPNAMHHARRAAVVEDVEWMHETSEHPLRWAQRVGMTNGALSRMLYRAGYRELAHEIERALNEDRKVAA